MHIIEPIAWQMGMEFLDGDLTFQDTTQLESWKFPASGQVPRNNDPNRYSGREPHGSTPW